MLKALPSEIKKRNLGKVIITKHESQHRKVIKSFYQGLVIDTYVFEKKKPTFEFN